MTLRVPFPDPSPQKTVCKEFILADVMRLVNERDKFFVKENKRFKKRESNAMMFIFFITALFTCILVAFGVMMSVAIFASPLLDDALFNKKEEHHGFWSVEVEYDESYYV